MKGCIEIAIVGFGLVGKRHVAALSLIDDIKLTAIVDPSETSKTYAVEQNMSHYTDLNDMLDKESPDGVILSTPTNLHAEQAIVCLEHNCPVLVEKPIADTSDAALKMVTLGLERNIPILVGHHRRHNPIIQLARKVIEKGLLGEVRSLNAICWFYKPDHYFEIAPWRTKKGAGPISVNLVHDVDLIRYMCGEVVSVDASSVPSRRGFDNEDIAAAILTFENGAIATLSIADSIVSPWSWELTSGEYPVYQQTDQSCYMIGGSTGALSVPDLRLWKHKEAPDWWTPISGKTLKYVPSDPMVTQIKHFAEVVRGEKEPIVSGSEGLRTLLVIEAIKLSAQEKQTKFIENFN